MSEHTRFLNIESCNFIDYPQGGQTTVAKQIMEAYKGEVALVGISTDDKIPVGKWCSVNINGTNYDYFSVRRVFITKEKPIIPERLRMWNAFRKYRKDIFSLGIHKYFVQAPEILFALENLPWKSVCVNMPGIENPIKNSRFKGAKYLATFFDYFYLKSLKKADKILASADHRTIKDFLATRAQNFTSGDIIHFPTRVETELFKPMDQKWAREKLRIEADKVPIFVVTGRLAKIKGWKFIIESFIIYNDLFGEAKLYFIGEGEDRKQIESFIRSNRLQKCIILMGAIPRDEIACWINAADIVLIGSFIEGWSLSMLESVACGKPIVSTEISGARDVIIEGINGFICNSRDPRKYAEFMQLALKLDRDEVINLSLKTVERYALNHLKEELDILWKR